MADPAAELLARRLDPEAALSALVEALAQVEGVDLRRREPMADHVPLRCGGPADLWVVVQDEQALQETLSATRKAGLSWQVSWPLEDVFVRDGGVRGVVVRPGLGFEGAELLPADDDGPARLRIGAAEPWAAARAALQSARQLASAADLARGPLAEVGGWPGCPGALLQSGDPAGLEGLCHATTWRRSRRVERFVLADGAAPVASPPSAVLLHVELPLLPIPGARRLRHRPSPPPPGTLFADDGPLASSKQLVAAGLIGTRLRAWRLSPSEPGTLVNLGGGDCSTAQLLAKGAADHANRQRGVKLDLRIPIIGSDGTRRR